MEIVYTEEELPRVAQGIIAASGSRTLCFYGEMGTGKTTLIKSIVEALGGADPANSPTFGIVNEYHFINDTLLGYHFDFYRLENIAEALDLGLEEYFGQGAWIFIEWPEKVAALLPEKIVELHIEEIDHTTRKIRILPS